MPEPASDIPSLKARAEGCRACPLWRDATRLVFGEGAPNAALVLVGEQPGDQEDLAGLPFVGPAGRVLNEALAAANIDRSRVYLTNAVKHFKHVRRGKRRLHQRPNSDEIEHCHWWLEEEIRLIRPTLVVALGATAGRAVFGRTMTISRSRGRIEAGALCGRDALLTAHPSYILRLPDAAAKKQELERLIADLVIARRHLEASQNA